jgi:hypothetical protein
MNGLELTLRLLSGVLLILANGFFVAIEFALTRVRQYPKCRFNRCLASSPSDQLDIAGVV